VAIKQSEVNRLTCPAAIVVHPVMSPHDTDIQCQIAGRVQPADGSPCCAVYTRCGIWQQAKRAEKNHARKALEEAREMQPHTLRGDVERDTVHVR
jgi:hypothetical protein